MKDHRSQTNCILARTALLATTGLWLSLSARAADIEVIYTEIASDPSSTVPGALDGAGQPADTDFLAIEEVVVSPDGSEWIVKGRTTQGTSADSILLRGSGLVGTMFAQDGQPFQGGVAGELYDFFDTPTPASWDSKGNLGFSARARGGVAAVFEKVVIVDADTDVHTIVLQMGDAALGLTDLPPNPSGDELFGNSINSVHLLDSGLVGFIVTPITNCHSSRYPAFFHGNTAFKQSGVSIINGDETWDNFDLDACGGTADGAHWFAKGDTENPDTSIDGIFVVDDVVMFQEGSPVAGSAVIYADTFFSRMLSSGDWFSRGDDPTDNDWAGRNNVLLAKTGDPITTGGTENWGNAFSAFTGDRNGNWLLAGNTNNADVNQDLVLVLNGEEVIARENDPIDLNGNGEFDDNVFINSFQPNDLHLTDDGAIYFLVTLRNAAGTALGDGFFRIVLPGQPCVADVAPDGGNGTVDIDDLFFIIAEWGNPGGPADIAPPGGNGIVDIDDLFEVIAGWGRCA